MRGTVRIKRALGSVRRWTRAGGVILMYHRVTDLAPDTYNLAVSPAHFAEHMEVLSRTCLPVHLTDMIEDVTAGDLPDRSVAVTFDDGYYDNFSEAYPLLQAYEVPATVFVVSGHIDSPQEFWWDELERVLLEPDSVPPRLRFNLDGGDFCWPTTTSEDRVLAHRALHGLLSKQNTRRRADLLRKLGAWSHVSPFGRPSHRAMRSEELVHLSDGGLVAVGGHTVNHPMLSTLTHAEQHFEITEGCRRLREIVGKPIEVFAYPFGGPRDWTEVTVEIVRNAGLQGAVVTTPGYIEAGADPFRLRRWAPADCDGDQFAHALESYFITHESVGVRV